MNTEFLLNSAYDGHPLSVVMVEPTQHPKIVLQIAHGLCGCKERYIPFMEYMSEHGVACVACDHRGHGNSVRSAAELGYMEGGYHALLADMRLINIWISKYFPGTPVVLLGHSMGSLAARIYAKEYDSELSGLILCGTPGYVPMARFAALITWILSHVNGGHIRPSMLQDYTTSHYDRGFPSEGKHAWICSDSAVRKEMRDNPLTNYHITSNMMHNLLRMMIEANSSRGWQVMNPHLHITFLSGEQDACMRGGKSLHDAAMLMCGLGYTNVTSAVFTEMRHEILNEVDKKIVWDDILDFMMHISSK